MNKIILLLSILLSLTTCGPKKQFSPKAIVELTSYHELSKELILAQDLPDPKSYPRLSELNLLDEKLAEPLNYSLDMDINPDQKEFSARLKIKINKKQQSEKIKMHAYQGLLIEGISVDGVVLNSWLHDQNLLTFDNPNPTIGTTVVEISYRSIGSLSGLRFVENNGSVIEAWTKSEPTYAREWMPSFDQPSFKAPIDFHFTVPAQWKVLANGQFGETKFISANKKQFNLVEKIPLPTYLYSVLAGELEVVLNDYQKFPLAYWVPKADVKQAVIGFMQAPQVLDYFSDLIAPYPFEKLGIGIAYDYSGAMEHASSITFGETANSPRDGFNISILAHEIAHHWFGDTVTCKTWNDLWLNEGFANYFEVLFWEKSLGKDKFMSRMYGYKKQYLGQDYFMGVGGTLGPIYNTQTLPSQKFGALAYQKGALVLNALRYTLGDEKFFKGIKYYLNKFKFQSADTSDFRIAMEESTSVDLKTFFNQWVFKAGQPDFEYKWQWLENSKKLHVTVNQIQNEKLGFFETPIDLYVMGNVAKTFRLNLAAQSSNTFDLEMNENPKFVILDPEQWILSNDKSKKSKAEWTEILNNSPTFLAKINALIQLDMSFENLLSVANSNVHEEIRAQAISLIADMDEKIVSKASKAESLKAFLNSESDKIRSTVISKGSKIFDSSFEDKFLDIFENDPYSYSKVYAAMVLADIGKEKTKETFYKELYRFPKRDYSLLAMVIRSIGVFKDKRATNRLLEMMDSNYGASEFMNTITSMALAEMQETRATVAIAKKLALTEQPGLSLGYIKALEKMGDRQAIPFLNDIVNDNYRSKDLRDAAAAAILKIQSVKN